MMLPVMKLNYNVTDFLGMINSIDIRAAIKKGLIMLQTEDMRCQR